MASCAYCDTTILFGGKRHGDLRFCNDKCLAAGAVAQTAAALPAADVALHVAKVHRGNCPQCDGQGPVDVHTSHRVWSALVMTQWSSRPLICCQRCGTKRKLGDAAFSLVLGWWGFPWGLIMTPVQVVKNVAGAFGGPNPDQPSAQLEKQLRMRLATHLLAQQQRQP